VGGKENSVFPLPDPKVFPARITGELSHGPVYFESKGGKGC